MYGETILSLGESWFTCTSATDALVAGLATARGETPLLNLATRAFTVPRGLARIGLSIARRCTAPLERSALRSPSESFVLASFPCGLVPGTSEAVSVDSGALMVAIFEELCLLAQPRLLERYKESGEELEVELS